MCKSMIGGILYVVLFAILIVDFRVYLVKLESLQLISYLFIAFMVLLVSFSASTSSPCSSFPYENVSIAEECAADYDRSSFPFTLDSDHVWSCCLY